MPNLAALPFRRILDRLMAEPGEPTATDASSAPLIDVEDPDQMILLGMSALFVAAAIVSHREQIPTRMLAHVCVACARELIDAVVNPQADPPPRAP